MARGYTASEGSTGKNAQRSWERYGELRNKISELKNEESSYIALIEKNPNDLNSRANLKSATDRLSFYKELNKKLSQYNKIKAGDLSVFEPPVIRASEAADASAQTAMYEMAKKDGVTLNTGNNTDELWEKYGKGNPMETSVSIDADGKRIFAVTGNANSIETTIWRPLSESIKGSHSWHNHPLGDGRLWGYAQSPSDIATLFARREMSGTVSAKEGTYTIGFTPSQWESVKNMSVDDAIYFSSEKEDSWNKVWMAAVHKYASKNGIQASNEIMKDPKHATAFLKMSNKILEEFAPKHGFTFKFTPRPEYASELS